MQENAIQRLNLLKSQIISNKCLNSGKVLPQSDDDIVICAALRTPLTKSRKGGLKDTLPEVMVSQVLDALTKKAGLSKDKVDEIVMGNVLIGGAGFMANRQAQFLGGFSEKTTFMSINRLCSSGLQAVMNAAYSIANKQCDIAIGGGVENMSIWDMQNMVDGEKVAEAVFDNEMAQNCMIPMGLTSENVAEKFGVNRETMDHFAVSSHNKAEAAQAKGNFVSEIVPIKTQVKNKDGQMVDITVDQDDGIRKGTKYENLKKLKAAFKQNGTTTAGNSSQVTDGAAAVLLTRRSVAKQLGLPIEARIVGYSVAGVLPEIMGIGPAEAIPRVLEKTGLTINDIDVFELNEAFASQATYCAKKLNIPEEKVNPNGGAIALGHPLGCTGARLIATLLPELRRQNKRYGIVSMCIGTGMGAAAVIEREN